MVCYGIFWSGQLSYDANSARIKVMLHGTICNDYLQRNTSFQHCCNIVWNCCNIVATLLRCVAQKIVVANRPL